MRRCGLSQPLSAGRSFHVSAELVAHGRQKLQSELILASRAESLIERGAQYGRGNGFVDGRNDGPASLAGIGNTSGKLREIGLVRQSSGGQIQQPGCHHASATPDLGDVGQIEIVLISVRDFAEAWFRHPTERSCLPALACFRMFSPSA